MWIFVGGESKTIRGQVDIFTSFYQIELEMIGKTDDD